MSNKYESWSWQTCDIFVTIDKETKDTPEEVTKVPLNDILREQIVTYL